MIEVTSRRPSPRQMPTAGRTFRRRRASAIVAALPPGVRPGVELVDMVAPGAAVEPAGGAAPAMPHRLQRVVRDAEMISSLLGVEVRAALARLAGTLVLVVHDPSKRRRLAPRW